MRSYKQNTANFTSTFTTIGLRLYYSSRTALHWGWEASDNIFLRFINSIFQYNVQKQRKLPLEVISTHFAVTCAWNHLTVYISGWTWWDYRWCALRFLFNQRLKTWVFKKIPIYVWLESVFAKLQSQQHVIIHRKHTKYQVHMKKTSAPVLLLSFQNLAQSLFTFFPHYHPPNSPSLSLLIAGFPNLKLCY